MKHGMGLGLALMVCGVVEAAEPPARAKPPTPAPAAIRPAANAPPGATHAPNALDAPDAARAANAPARPAKPLDLRIGDIRRYMLPRDYVAAVYSPDAEANTVVVEGQRELAPMKRVEDVPLGLPALWYSVKDPKNSWRLLAPAITFKDGPTVDKVPPPIFRWGP